MQEQSKVFFLYYFGYACVIGLLYRCAYPFTRVIKTKPFFVCSNGNETVKKIECVKEHFVSLNFSFVLSLIVMYFIVGVFARFMTMDVTRNILLKRIFDISFVYDLLRLFTALQFWFAFRRHV